jgi:hypothetical protein
VIFNGYRGIKIKALQEQVCIDKEKESAFLLLKVKMSGMEWKQTRGGKKLSF